MCSRLEVSVYISSDASHLQCGIHGKPEQTRPSTGWLVLEVEEVEMHGFSNTYPYRYRAQ